MTFESLTQLLEGQSPQESRDIGRFLIQMVLGAVIGVMTSIVFRVFATTVSDRARFSRIFVPVLLSTIIIVSTVKYSITLSLGLVGALSIVRFRSAIKEPEEIVYLFFCIAIGVTLGAGMTVHALSASATFFVIISALSYFSKKESLQRYLLTVSVPLAEREATMDTLLAWLKEAAFNSDMIRLDHREDQVSLRIEFTPKSSAMEYTSQLQDLLPGVPLSISRTHVP